LILYLPAIIIPFAGLSLLIKKKDKKIIEFKKKINKALIIPIYFVLGTLILLIEIFSISIAGLIFFAMIIFLFLK
jgi:hypothetical protein